MKSDGKPTHIRYWILFLLFVVSTISYADRTVLSIAARDVTKALDIDAAQLGWIFSSFAWSYALAQIPGGFLLDRFGARLVYALALTLWSVFTLFQGVAGFFAGFSAFILPAMAFPPISPTCLDARQQTLDIAHGSRYDAAWQTARLRNPRG